jgi:predicted MFS family arabinose efflux permease
MQHDTAQTGKIPASAWRALAVLTLIYVCHSIDRSVMSIVIEPIKDEFGLSDSQIGILGGLVYAVLYAIAGLPLGYLIDRVNRRNLLAGLVAIWSGFTVLCGFTQNYVQLLVARAAVGAAEAGGAPTAISMISDLFPERRRSTAISIFWLSTAIGTALSFALGGLVAAKYGWRAAFLVAGAPGLLLAGLLLVAIKEPVRGSNDPDPDAVSATPPTLGEAVRFAFAHPAFLNAFIATALKAAVLSGVLVWAGSYLIRVQGLPLAWAGLVIGVCIAVFGGAGSLLGGWLGDRLYAAGGVRYLPIGPMATSAATAVCVILFALTDNLYISIAAFAAFEVFSRMYSAPSYAFIVSTVDPRMRGIAVSTLQVSANLIGYGFGPFVVGLVSDAIGGPDSIRYGLSGLSAISLWVGVHYYLAYRLSPHRDPRPSNTLVMETHT